MVGNDGVYRQHFDFHDGLLFQTALDRYRKSLTGKNSYFLMVQPLSNHPPYIFPSEIDGKKFPKNHDGGTMFTDYALGTFLDKLMELPKEQRPIIFITSDTTHSEGLIEAAHVGRGKLERMRIPGLLILPDKKMSGETYDGLFCHEDMLDFLYLLIAPESENKMSKFFKKHRIIAPTKKLELLISKLTYFNVKTGEMLNIKNHWELEQIDKPKDLEPLLKAREEMRIMDKKLWFSYENQS